MIRQHVRIALLGIARLLALKPIFAQGTHHNR